MHMSVFVCAALLARSRLPFLSVLLMQFSLGRSILNRADIYRRQIFFFPFSSASHLRRRRCRHCVHHFIFVIHSCHIFFISLFLAPIFITNNKRWKKCIAFSEINSLCHLVSLTMLIDGERVRGSKVKIRKMKRPKPVKEESEREIEREKKKTKQNVKTEKYTAWIIYKWFWTKKQFKTDKRKCDFFFLFDFRIVLPENPLIMFYCLTEPRTRA